ncbi:MAG: cob(I)yrinic acid a,c-diamide adenosyltransferase [Methanomethylophilus alvi]|nr:MAG: cob(I)yrinic acid a,c-diamide adenosyltransferase [Methanomethylophilus alvi]WII09905.1 cob(I)yrinic acid a,c-diamide adenosyltransferase [Methanomassiliicoccales archaeon LGM-DZ1]
MEESQDPREQLGLVQIYTGNGKGKTTAALGLALRASGRGLKVLFLQFLKPEGGYGEQLACAKIPGIDLIPMGLDHFVGIAKGEDVAAAHRCLSKAAELMGTGRYDVAVLDESVNAVRLKLITSKELIDVLKGRPEHVEVILTGRGATEDLVDYADLVTDMRLVKHPFDKGIDARIGIEY